MPIFLQSLIMMSLYLPEVVDAFTIWNLYVRAGTPFFEPSSAVMYDSVCMCAACVLAYMACMRIREHVLHTLKRCAFHSGAHELRRLRGSLPRV